MAHNRKRRDGAAVADCINLAARFGERYRITYEPAYDAKGRPHAKRDPWMMVVECRYGTIYPEGDQWLRIDLLRHNQIANRLASLPDCELGNDGDYEKTVRFPIARFAAVAKIVKPGRRPILSTGRREQLRKRMSHMRQQFPEKSQLKRPLSPPRNQACSE